MSKKSHENMRRVLNFGNTCIPLEYILRDMYTNDFIFQANITKHKISSGLKLF